MGSEEQCKASEVCLTELAVLVKPCSAAQWMSDRRSMETLSSGRPAFHRKHYFFFFSSSFPLLSLPLSLLFFFSWISLCLLPSCHAPLSNLCSLCLLSLIFFFYLFSTISCSSSSSSSFTSSCCALSYLPLQSCEKVGTVLSVCGSFEYFSFPVKVPLFVFLCRLVFCEISPQLTPLKYAVPQVLHFIVFLWVHAYLLWGWVFF